MLLALSACIHHPLPHVPLRGGSPDQQQAAIETLLAFDQAIGPGRLELREVHFHDDPDKRMLGSYDLSHIDLEPSLTPERVRSVLRHELCHALDHSERISPRHSRDLLPLLYLADDEVPDKRHRETFAELCEEGPLFPPLLAVPCEGRSDHSGLAEMLAEQVWREAEGMPVLEETGERIAISSDFPLTPRDLTVGWSSEGARWKVWADRGRVSFTVDPYTGVVDPDTSTFRYAPELERLDEHALPSPGLQIRKLTGSASSAAAEAGLDGLWRVIVWDGQRWSLAPQGCPPDDPARAAFLSTDGRLWATQNEGETLSWRALPPSQ